MPAQKQHHLKGQLGYHGVAEVDGPVGERKAMSQTHTFISTEFQVGSKYSVMNSTRAHLYKLQYATIVYNC